MRLRDRLGILRSVDARRRFSPPVWISLHLQKLDPVAFAELSALIILISSSPAISQQDGENVQRDTVEARSASYEVRDDPSEEGRKCLFRNDKQLLCPGTAFVAFEKHYKTRNYDLIVISMGELGSGTRWWDWKLIVENVEQAVIKPLANECLECDIQLERLNASSDEAEFTYRQNKHHVSASFRSGELTLRKRKLDQREPLDRKTCDTLFGNYEGCGGTKRDPANCMIAQANSSHFALLRAEDRYAGISYEGLQRLCKTTCSTGEPLSRAVFFKKVCRR